MKKLEEIIKEKKKKKYLKEMRGEVMIKENDEEGEEKELKKEV